MRYISSITVDKLIIDYPDVLQSFTLVFDIQEGWAELINDLCKSTQIYAKQENITSFTFTKFERKFGGLFVSYEVGDFIIDKIIRFSERISFNICEECGKRGYLHSSTGNEWGTIETLCSTHAIRKLYKRVDAIGLIGKC